VQLFECESGFGVAFGSEETRGGLLFQTNLFETLSGSFEVFACLDAKLMSFL
jgi:hypothetical protein